MTSEKKGMLSLLLMVLCGALPSLAVPRIAVPPEGVALGEVVAGESAHGEIAVRNTGDSPLGVSRAKASCLRPTTREAGKMI